MNLVSTHLVWACAAVTLMVALVAAVLLGRREGRLRRTAALVSVLLTATLLLVTLGASANARMGWFKTTGDIWRTLSDHQGAESGLDVVPLPGPSASGGAASAAGDGSDTPLPDSLSAHPGSAEWTTAFSWNPTENAWRAQVNGPASGLDRSVTVWTSPGYSPSSATTYDVVVFLHGFPGSDSGVIKALDVDSAIRGLTDQGDLEPTIFVVADLSMGGAPPNCVDIQGQPAVETFVTQDLVQSIRTNFPNVSGMRSGWLIAGVSAGAYCAPVLYLRHQDQFWGAVGMSGYDNPQLGALSAASQSVKDSFTISTMIADRDRQGANLWLSGTGNDPDSMTLLDKSVRAAGGDDDITTYVDPAGGHSWSTWSKQFPLALKWWEQKDLDGAATGGVLQSGAAQSGGSQSGATEPSSASSILSGLARAFALDGWGTLVGSLLLFAGLLVGLVRVGPLTAWRGRGRVPGYLFRLLGLAVVSAVMCVCVIIIANRPQGFFSSWSDLFGNWSMFF
ncbi:MAG: alpha/beta hydrolase [Pauljensenia sp.]